MSSLANAKPWSPFFIRELQELAQFLDDLGMSQELINMTLAARAGLPVAPVDPKSPVFVWEKDEAPAPEAQPRSLDERREAVLQAIKGMGVADIIDVLSLPLNTALAKTGMVATISVRNTFSYKE
ncbi:hypothetical protein Bwad001_10250 [Bilophila wadsworthia]|uniref:hypothetical protein n=1 Tax=Bilophila wadsworthia TaxID=35833 RepID=UPI00049521E1|nr:hypothetical protein [Bilophila wadsworthia]